MVPDRLAYAELFDSQYRYSATSQPANTADETHALVCMLKQLAAAKATHTLKPAPKVDELSWQHLKPHYQQLMDTTIACFNR